MKLVLIFRISFQSTCLKIVSENKILVGNDVGAIIECNLYVKKYRIHQKYSTESNPGLYENTIL